MFLCPFSIHSHNSVISFLPLNCLFILLYPFVNQCSLRDMLKSCRSQLLHSHFVNKINYGSIGDSLTIFMVNIFGFTFQLLISASFFINYIEYLTNMHVICVGGS